MDWALATAEERQAAGSRAHEFGCPSIAMVGEARARLEWSPRPLLPSSLGLKAPLRSSNWIFGPYKLDVDASTSHPLFKAMRRSPTNLGFLFQISSTPLFHLCLQTPRPPKFPASHHLLEALQEEVPSFQEVRAICTLFPFYPGGFMRQRGPGAKFTGGSGQALLIP